MNTKRITRSPSGHRCGSSHQRAKLTTEQVKEMRSLRSIGGQVWLWLINCTRYCKLLDESVIMRLKEHVKLSIKLMERHSESTKQKRVPLRGKV